MLPHAPLVVASVVASLLVACSNTPATKQPPAPQPAPSPINAYVASWIGVEQSLKAVHASPMGYIEVASGTVTAGGELTLRLLEGNAIAPAVPPPPVLPAPPCDSGALVTEPPTVRTIDVNVFDYYTPIGYDPPPSGVLFLANFDLTVPAPPGAAFVVFTYATEAARMTGACVLGDRSWEVDLNLVAGWNVQVVLPSPDGKHVVQRTGPIPPSVTWRYLPSFGP